MKKLKKGFPEHLKVIEYTEMLGPYEVEKVVMFNSTVVSTAEVYSWIEQCPFAVDSKPTVVVMTKTQYENLFDHFVNDDCLYTDLALEQRETM